MPHVWHWLHDHLVAVWQWLGSALPGQAAFLGTLIGSSIGLMALLFGALFNAYLTRNRDDRLRREDQRSVAVALLAELSGIHHELFRSSEDIQKLQNRDDPKQDHFLVRDVSQAVRIFPEIISKIGLLDPDTIQRTSNAYHAVEHRYGMRLLFIGDGQV
jgi:hypothetical protein